MPISYATLQIYDQYLTTYGSKRCSRYDTHDSKRAQRAIQFHTVKEPVRTGIFKEPYC